MVAQELGALGDLVVGGSELLRNLVQVHQGEADADGSEYLTGLVLQTLDALLGLLL